MSEGEVGELEESTGSAEDDIRAMRAKIRKLEAELKERDVERVEVLGPALAGQRRDLLRTKGFDPDSVPGKRLVKAWADGEIQADGSDLVEVAEAGYGWTPSLQGRGLTDAEIAYLHFGDKGRELNSVTTSDQAPTKEQAIEEAEAAGDTKLANSIRAGVLADALNRSR